MVQELLTTLHSLLSEFYKATGRLVCHYVLNRGCELEKSVFYFRTVQGGTNKLERHIRQHTQNLSNANRFLRTLPHAAKQAVAQAAALDVALDVQTLPFCDGHLGLSNFSTTLFELDQIVSVNEKLTMRLTCQEEQLFTVLYTVYVTNTAPRILIGIRFMKFDHMNNYVRINCRSKRD